MLWFHGGEYWFTSEWERWEQWMDMGWCALANSYFSPGAYL